MPQNIRVKSILNKTRHRDEWFLDDYTVNPYSGCSFNCLFCYIRGSKYGINMAEKLSVKANAVELLEHALSLRARKNQYGIIVFSSATDPYLQFEKEQQLTRKLLEVVLKFRFPVHIITRSDLVIRDFDLLREIETAAILPHDLRDKLKRKLFITFSFSTIDNNISGIFEPGATPPTQRLEAMNAALINGFHSGVSMMPMLPFISDTSTHLETMFQTFRAMGVKYIFPASINLFGNGTSDSKTLVLRAIERHYPELLEKYRQFFQNSDCMPGYYREAFVRKMTELLNKYDLKNSII
jgi:DNA repair photolyase